MEKLEQANPTSKLNQKSKLTTQLAEARQKKPKIISRKGVKRKATRKTLKNHHDIARQTQGTWEIWMEKEKYSPQARDGGHNI
jgi:hypothetical protein